MRFLARMYLLALLCGLVTIALASHGCEFSVVETPAPIQLEKSPIEQCNRLPHDDRVMCEYCTKYPKICLAK